MITCLKLDKRHPRKQKSKIKNWSKNKNIYLCILTILSWPIFTYCDSEAEKNLQDDALHQLEL